MAIFTPCHVLDWKPATTDAVGELPSSRGRQGPLLSPTLRTPLPPVTDVSEARSHRGRASGWSTERVSGEVPGVKRKENEGAGSQQVRHTGVPGVHAHCLRNLLVLAEVGAIPTVHKVISKKTMTTLPKATNPFLPRANLRIQSPPVSGYDLPGV